MYKLFVAVYYSRVALQTNVIEFNTKAEANLAYMNLVKDSDNTVARSTTVVRLYKYED